MTDQIPCTLHLTSKDNSLEAAFAGDWVLETEVEVPTIEPVFAQLGDAKNIKKLVFSTKEPGRWDSLLMIGFINLINYAKKQGVSVDMASLPEGIQGLLNLVYAEPKQAGIRQVQMQGSLLAVIGNAGLLIRPFRSEPYALRLSKHTPPFDRLKVNGDLILHKAKSIDKSENPLIGLCCIHIPAYIDRPQLVITVTYHQYRFSEDHRWAESLDKNISLALFKAVPDQLGTGRILRYPWPQRLAIDYQIGIDILELNVYGNSQSRLTAHWYIKRKGQTTIDKRFDCRIPSSNTDYEVMVNTQSQCLGNLGREIADTFGHIHQNGY